MTPILILASVFLILQIVLFFVIKKHKKKIQEPSEIEKKYSIETRSDVWNALNRPDIPDDDRLALEKIYSEMEAGL